MAKPTVANYILFTDAAFELQAGADINRTLTRNIEDVPVSGQGALLTWNVKRVGTGNVTYTVHLNGSLINTHTVTLGERRAMQEATGTENVRQGENNVVFEVTDGTGILNVSSVMCFYRQEV
jgi:hypothetical protein